MTPKEIQSANDRDPLTVSPLELIKDAAFYGGTVPNERLEECREFMENIAKLKKDKSELLKWLKWNMDDADRLCTEFQRHGVIEVWQAARQDTNRIVIEYITNQNELLKI